MRRIAIACVGLFVGCSFIDDFDKFKPELVSSEEDAGQRPPDDGLDGGDTPGDGRDADGPPAVDASRDAGNGADAAVVDSGVSRCGDGVTDRARGEQCDDGNLNSGDGCEPVTCTFGPPNQCTFMTCNDDDPCTTDGCNAFSGCQYVPIDADNDGFSPGKCKGGGAYRGGDCNDAKASINPAAHEVCDGVDNNCDGKLDEGSPVLRCYPDADGDGYPALDVAPHDACVCPPGTIEVDNPSDRTMGDCFDDALNGADVFPKQTKFFTTPYGTGPRKDRSFDYDCSGGVTQQYALLPAGGCPGLLDLLLCGMASGFVGDMPPECGVAGDYTTCGEGTVGKCSGSTEQRTQACH